MRLLAKVRDVMSSNVITIETSLSILDAARLMNRKAISGVVAVSDGKPAGIVTARSILRKFIPLNIKPDETKVSEIMYTPLLTVRPGDDVKKAARLLVKDKLTRLVVLDGDKAVGIVTLTDLAAKFSKKNLVDAVTESWKKEKTLTCPACKQDKLVLADEYYGPVWRCPKCRYILD